MWLHLLVFQPRLFPLEMKPEAPEDEFKEEEKILPGK